MLRGWVPTATAQYLSLSYWLQHYFFFPHKMAEGINCIDMAKAMVLKHTVWDHKEKKAILKRTVPTGTSSDPSNTGAPALPAGGRDSAHTLSFLQNPPSPEWTVCSWNNTKPHNEAQDSPTVLTLGPLCTFASQGLAPASALLAKRYTER